MKTDADGNAQFEFTAEREGYYRVAWESSPKTAATATTISRNRFLPPIKAETTVFVATNATTDLGYRHAGVEIVVDKDTFRAGQTAPVMLSTFTNDRYVLFSVEGGDLYSYKLIHVTGTAKLIELPIEEKHVPNIYLSAVMVSDAQLFADTKQVVVPPVRQFLAVDVKADREQYQPREEGTLSITTKDADGKPVSAEVALGMSRRIGQIHPGGLCRRPAPVLLRQQARADGPNAEQFQSKVVCEAGRRAGQESD